MHFRVALDGALGTLAAVVTAIGRMLLTSSIMKSQALFRYTEYPDMFG